MVPYRLAEPINDDKSTLLEIPAEMTKNYVDKEKCLRWLQRSGHIRTNTVTKSTIRYRNFSRNSNQ